MKSVIVTGANGFVGHHLVRCLSEQGYYIYAVIRNQQEDVANILDVPNLKIIYCDMEEIFQLPDLIHDRNICSAYHLAWAGSSGDLRKNYSLQMKNVEWSCHFIETVAKMNIKRVIVSGSVTQLMYREYLTEDEIAPEMVTCYAIGKITAEYMCKCIAAELGINLCWAYISNFYGADDPTNNFINFLLDNYLNGETPTLTPAEQLADFAYVTDIAEGLICACERGKSNTSYYIGYGSPKPLKEFIAEVRDIVNPKLESGIGRKKFNGRNVDFTKIDVEKLSRDTGYKARVTFGEGIRKLIEYRKYNGDIQ